MIGRVRFWRRLRHDTRGVSVVEFALFSIPLLTVIMGGIELGYRMMMLSRLDGAVKAAARMATTGQFTGTQIDNYVTTVASGIRGSAPPEISKRSYDTFSAVGKPEPITSDTAPVGEYNIGDCYEDRNRNGVWDNGNSSGYAGLGNADDIIRYSATVTYPTLFPFLVKMAGFTETATISATTVMQNEPYASSSSSSPQIKCS